MQDENPAKPPGPRPGTLRFILRGGLALVAGFLVMSVLVMIYQGLFLMLPLYLSDPAVFQRMVEAGSDPEKMKALMESGDMPIPGTPMLALTVLLDGVCAAAGGFVAAWIARRHKFGHAVLLAVLLTLMSIGYAATSELEALLPAWVPWSRALLFIPLGVLAGGWLRACCCQPRVDSIGQPED